MAEETILLNIKLNESEVKKATQTAAEARAEVDRLRKANRELTKAEGDNSIAIQKNNLEIKKNSATLRENERILVANEKVSKSNAGSIDQLRAQLAITTQQWNKLSQEERESTEVGKALSKQKLDLTDKLKAEEKATGDTRRNVGNYSEGVQDALEKSGLFGRQLGRLKQAQQVYTAATQGSVKGLRAFRLALIATGIGAIVAALGGLIAAFTSTQKGADEISKALAPVKAIFQGLIGIAQDLSLQLFDAFKNPKQAVSDLWEAIKTNIVNRIIAVPEVFKGVFDTISNSFSFLGNSIKAIVADIPIIGRGIDKAAAKKNADEAAGLLKESLKATAQAIIQTQTGLDKEQQEQLKNFVKGQKERLDTAAETGKRITDLNIQIEKSEIELTKQRAKLNAEFERSKEIAQDDTKTEEERRAAAAAAIEAQDKLLKANQEFLDLQIEKKKLELSLNDSDREAKLELANLESERTKFEAEASRKRVSARNLLETIDKQIHTDRMARISELEKEEAEFQEVIEAQALLRIEKEKARLAEERAEGLINKEEYEQALVQIELDTLTQAREAAELARQEALENTELTELEKQRIILESEKIITEARQRTAELSIAAQEETTDVVEKTEEQKVEQSKVSSADIISGTQSIAKEGSTAAKAAGVAQSTISTYTAAAKALEGGPILGPILAALVTAKGLLNVQKIVSTPTPSFAKGGYTGQGYGDRDSSGYKQAGVVHEGEYVVKKSMVENPSIAPIVSQLEGMRLRGYADGGFVGRSALQGNNAVTDLNALQQILQNMPPQVVRVSDINSAATRRNKVRVESSLS